MSAQAAPQIIRRIQWESFLLLTIDLDRATQIPPRHAFNVPPGKTYGRRRTHHLILAVLNQKETYLLQCGQSFRLSLRALFNYVALAFFHRLHPCINRLLFFYRLNLRLKTIKRHIVNAIVKMALHKFLIAVVIRWPQ